MQQCKVDYNEGYSLYAAVRYNVKGKLHSLLLYLFVFVFKFCGRVNENNPGFFATFIIKMLSKNILYILN